jgi:hypothetical protein
MKQTNKKAIQKIVPFGKANPRRGQRYAGAKTAEEFLEAYPLNTEMDSVALKKWGQTREEFTTKMRRNVNRIVSVLRTLGTSKYTPSPFYVQNLGPNRWRVQSSKETITGFDITTGMKQMAEGRKQKLRHLVESINPDDYSQMDRLWMEIVWDQDDQFVAVVLRTIEAWQEAFEKQIKRLQAGGSEERRQLG